MERVSRLCESMSDIACRPLAVSRLVQRSSYELRFRLSDAALSVGSGLAVSVNLLGCVLLLRSHSHCSSQLSHNVICCRSRPIM